MILWPVVVNQYSQGPHIYKRESGHVDPPESRFLCTQQNYAWQCLPKRVGGAYVNKSGLSSLNVLLVDLFFKILLLACLVF